MTGESVGQAKVVLKIGSPPCLILLFKMVEFIPSPKLFVLNSNKQKQTMRDNTFFDVINDILMDFFKSYK